ncbi:hypothetical protein DER46DRAFT_118076 [Fusarium sp. MPI-SDFR-AT-0072]|nr:hypothetical protein DER46DRAFT_118076 [Fusarium sp. MPI-SDFR-AT-0072]
MQSTLPGPCEFVVTSLHGSAAISDGEFPVTLSPSSQGAIVTAKDLAVGIGKIHFALPTLRSLEDETALGKLTGHAIASTRLEVLVSPHGQPATDSHSKIIQVELYAGRDQIGSWENSDDDCLPTNQDLRLDIDADIVGAGDNPFSDNASGLCVTITVDFVSSESTLLVSSVALVQTIGPRKKV